MTTKQEESIISPVKPFKPSMKLEDCKTWEEQKNYFDEFYAHVDRFIAFHDLWSAVQELEPEKMGALSGALLVCDSRKIVH